MGIRSEPSSPYHPESNGLAESSVKHMKSLLFKCKYERSNFDRALAQWLQTPREDGYSPSDLFFKRHLRGLLPSVPRTIDVQKGGGARDRKQKEYRDQMSKHAPLAPLMVDDWVVLQDPKSGLWDTRGKITDIRSQGRSYWVETLDGEKYLRGRPMLRKDISSETDSDMTSRPESDGDMTDIQTRNDRLTDDSHASRRGPSPVTAGLSRGTHTLTTHGDRQLVSPVAEGPILRQTRRGSSQI